MNGTRRGRTGALVIIGLVAAMLVAVPATITNTGTTAVDGWTLAFAFTAGQRVTAGWSATWDQPDGSGTVTATNLPWNAVIAPGTSLNIGFNGSFTTTNPAPTGFTLSGAACTTG